MEYTQLGTTSIKVSRPGLGTMTWGEQNTEAEAHQQLDYATEMGINFIDTAEMYPIPIKPETYGKTEEFTGTWLNKRKKRDDLVIATKIVGYREDAVHIRGGTTFTPKHLREALEGSLQRLQTDYVDLYQLHWPMRRANYFGKLGYSHDENDEEQNNFHEILATFQDFIQEGKIRYCGISNETPWGTMSYLKLAEMYDLPRIQSIQNPYSLLNRTFEIGLSEIALRENIGLLAYSPLAGGFLTGKYFTENPPADARFNKFNNGARYEKPNSYAAAREYVKLAREAGLSPAKMALAFVSSRDFVTSTLIGATSMEQLRENIAGVQMQLPNDLEAKIEAIHQQYPNPAP